MRQRHEARSALARMFVGCGSGTKQGPHSLACLAEFWREAGCYETGGSAPGSDDTQLRYWNSHTVEEVHNDMRLYYTLAVAGDVSYQQKCFGKCNTELPFTCCLCHVLRKLRSRVTRFVATCSRLGRCVVLIAGVVLRLWGRASQIALMLCYDCSDVLGRLS